MDTGDEVGLCEGAAVDGRCYPLERVPVVVELRGAATRIILVPLRPGASDKAADQALPQGFMAM